MLCSLLKMWFKNCFLAVTVFSFVISGCATIKTSARQENLSLGEKAYQEGNYERAVVLLEGYLAQGRFVERADETQFLLAEAYYNLKDYQQSARVFQRYLDNFPQGEKRKDAYEHLQQINQILAADNEIQKKTADTSLVGEEEQALVKAANVIIEKDHSYTLSPTYSLSPTYPGDNGVESYFVVTGIAFNKGTQPAQDVRVQVTLYDFFEHILDVGYAGLGSLEPGERKPFSIKMPHFKTVTVDRYVQTVTVDRYEIRPLWSNK